MDSKMCLLFSALLLFLIINELLANDVNINFKVLRRTMEKSLPQLKLGNANSSSAAIRKREDEQPSNVFYGTTMSWARFSGNVPSGAVSYWNSHANRREYPCRVSDCSAGYYSSSSGPYCYYAYGNKEYSTSEFWILVNGYDFESLSWKEGSWGKVPPNSINTCAGIDIYVGKNKYGLGKVDSKNQAFFIGMNGKEYWYKYYDVLTINKGYRSQSISNVNYKLNKGSFNERGMVLASSKVTNKNCKSVKKTTTLSGTVTSEHSWDTGMTLSNSLSFTMTAGIPDIFEASWGISSEKTFNWEKGYTYTESFTYSEAIEIEVPPSHSCELVMNGIKMKGQIPFTATATRYYYDGTHRSATVDGVSYNVVGVKGDSHVERCVLIPNALPCTG